MSGGSAASRFFHGNAPNSPTNPMPVVQPTADDDRNEREAVTRANAVTTTPLDRAR